MSASVQSGTLASAGFLPPSLSSPEAVRCVRGSAGALGTVVLSLRWEEGNSLWGAGSLAQHEEDVSSVAVSHSDCSSAHTL